VKPLDPRLLRYATAAKSFFVTGAALGVVQTALTVAFAFFVSRGVVVVVDGEVGRLPGYLVALAVTIVLRSLVIWALEVVAARSAARVKSQLRIRVLDAVTRRGRTWLAGQNSGRLVTLIGPGLDALDDYFAKYLPQLILTALATPLLVVVMFSQDLLSGVIVVVTLPLIPVFMILIGWTTQSAQARQWDRLASLASSFLDAVNGLSTLKVFGRERRQIRRIGAITDDYRRSTMKVLQVSFLSGFALEMAASLSVALVAVAIGVRLVSGSLELPMGLFLLLLAPEVYLPLRQLGANFHAAADGVAAAEKVFEVLGDSAETGGVAPAGPARASVTRPEDPDVLELRDVTVDHGHGIVVGPVDLDVPTGELIVLTGPSGIGKSSLVAAILGAVASGGTIRWEATGERPTPGETSWSGQQPGLLGGTVAANIALGDEIDSEAVASALAEVGAGDIDAGAELGAGGTGLSGGQAQRVALARALYRLRRRDGRLLVVDEPSSALDRATERLLVEGLRRVASSGVAVLVVTHRPGVRDAADRVYELDSTGSRLVAGKVLA
jgi:ATP-binding cassette, subfamily C, bacterial CydD